MTWLKRFNVLSQEAEMLHGIKAVIFDYDGTLLDICGAQYIAKLFQNYGLEIGVENERLLLDWSIDRLVAYLNESLAAKQSDLTATGDQLKAFFNRLEYKLFPDVLPVLRKLRADGVLNLLVSNRTDQALSEQLSKHGIDRNLFFYVKGVYGTPFEKPHPDGIAEAVDLLRKERIIVPDQVVSVADHLWDWEVADAWNIRFFALTCGVTPKQKFIDAGLPESRIRASLTDIFLK